MSMVSITCPSCGFSRQMPADRVPEGEKKVTCPQCRSVFVFRKSAPEPVAAPQVEAPSPGPTPPVSSQHSPEPQDRQPAQLQPPLQPQPQPQPQPQQPQSQPQPQPQAASGPSPTAGASGTGPGRTAPIRTAQRSRPAPRRELTDVGGLFRESWEVFQRRFSTLIGLFLLSVVAFTAPVGAAVGVGLLAGMALGKIAVMLVGLVGLAGSVYLGFRCFAGFLHAVVDEGLSLKEALSKGKGMVGSLAWVGFLTGFIIAGGYLLLVIPGIVFTVWFCLAQFVLVREGHRGMDALLKAKEYVRGEWFNVALRLLLVWAASLLVGAIPVAGVLLSIVFIPYMTIFHYLLYRDLQAMKGDVPFNCGVADRLKWPALALVGMVAVPVVLISVIGVSLLGPLAQFASREGVTVVQEGSTWQPAASGSGDIRVITFPQEPQAGAVPAQPTDQPASAPAEGGASQPAGEEVPPNDIHLFIYAVNYTGTVKVNGTPVREMEGKPDVQYNYNLNGRSLRYGQNVVEVEYAEVPSHHEGLLGVKVKFSRSRSGGPTEVLGEYRVEEKGMGTAVFTLDIPR